MTRGARRTAIVVNAMLCDVAFVLDDDVVVQGGVRGSFTAIGSPPKVAPIGVAVHLEVPGDAVGMRHTLQVSLEDATGAPVALVSSPTEARRTRYVLEAEFDVYGPVPAGRATLRVPWCTNLQDVTVPHLGAYQLVLSVDNVDARRLGFDVHAPS